MSLVERALQKIQAGRTRPDGAAPAAHVPPTPSHAYDAARTPPVEARAYKPFTKPTAVAKFDRDQLRRLNLLPPATLERRLAGQFQLSKRPLVTAAIHPGTETDVNAAIMVASAVP